MHEYNCFIHELQLAHIYYVWYYKSCVIWTNWKSLMNYSQSYQVANYCYLNRRNSIHIIAEYRVTLKSTRMSWTHELVMKTSLKFWGFCLFLVLDEPKMKRMMMVHPQGLVRFQVYHDKEKQLVTSEARRRNRVKNKNKKNPPLDLWANWVVNSILVDD